MIFGVDISKYQGPEAMDGWDFVILNVEDPTIGAKIDHAYDINMRWDIYKWCYPGQGGQAMFDRAKGIVDRYHRSGTRRPQFWLDYEEAGVERWQIDQWYQACDSGGEQTGLYIYLYLMNNQGVTFDRDGWIAYYPAGSDYAPWMSDTARARGAKLHQYTSTGGTIDKNVVLDETWYGFVLPPLPPLPPIEPVEEDEDMTYFIEKASNPALGAYTTNGVHKRHTKIDEWNFARLVASLAGKPEPKALPVSDEWWDSIPDITP